MWWVVGVFVFLLLWMVVGCAVLATIDDEERRLYKWATSPGGIVTLVIVAWPFVWWKWRRGTVND